MQRGAPVFIALVAALCVLLTGLSWSAHVDVPAAGQSGLSVTHEHIDAGEVVSDCDHCCHAGAHLVALTPAPGSHALVATTQGLPEAMDTVPQTEPEPPYTPPIV